MSSDQPAGEPVIRTIAMPADTNPDGDMFGGWIVSQMDLAAYLTARKIARCKMVVAVREGFDYQACLRSGARLKVATKYVKTARQHFAAKGMHVDLIKLYGSMELAPLVGLADAIVDLVSTGGTLKANHLVAVEHVADVSSYLVVNQASFKLNKNLIQPMMDAFAQAVKNRSNA